MEKRCHRAHNLNLMALVCQAAYKQSLCIYINDTWKTWKKYHLEPYGWCNRRSRWLVGCVYVWELLWDAMPIKGCFGNLMRARKKICCSSRLIQVGVEVDLLLEAARMWVNGNVEAASIKQLLCWFELFLFSRFSKCFIYCHTTHSNIVLLASEKVLFVVCCSRFTSSLVYTGKDPEIKKKNTDL